MGAPRLETSARDSVEALKLDGMRKPYPVVVVARPTESPHAGLSFIGKLCRGALPKSRAGDGGDPLQNLVAYLRCDWLAPGATPRTPTPPKAGVRIG